MKFLRNLLASIIGSLIAMGFLFLLFLGLVAIMNSEETIVVKNDSVLEISLDRILKDYAPKSDHPIIELMGGNDERIGLNEIINAIENATYDPNILGVSIQTIGVSGGLAQLRTIRNKLKEFKESGKFVKAYADIYNQKSYYLSSVADDVYLNPVGAVDFKGLNSEVLFFKELEDQTGVKMEVIRHGKYKSAVEPFLSNEMSDNNREQITSFLNSIWNEMLVDISESRAMTVDELNEVADNLWARNALLAVEHNIIDAAIYKDEYNDKIKIAGGKSADDKINIISLPNYIASGKGRLKSTSSDRIAVIYAQGEIMYGEGNEDIIGQELIIKALKKARKSRATKAVVLRIDSPGGSALASELIWRELELTKEEMPLVVSLGNVAASGGYYLACNAERIFAEPTTITGSIGVFGVVPNISKLAGNIGINAEQVATNKGASYSVFEPMSDEFRALAKEGVEQVYTTFLERVAIGRKMSTEAVDSIAQGRVWSGEEALENGLIDELGGLEDAVSYAADLAGISDFRVRNYPNYNVDLEDSFKGFPFIKIKEKLLADEFGEENYKIYQTVKQFSQVKGVQARLPFIIDIE